MLIIFDCDGVLVDSEIISAHVNAEHLTAEGYAISPGEVNERFAGLTGEQTMAVIEETLGRRLPKDFMETIDAEIDRRLAKVTMIAGADALLDVLDGARCICSNSSSARLKITLTATGLYDRFKPYIFSAPELGDGRSKPAPDVFLHAARTLETAPADVIVIEDSVPGVTGAVAAGMRVIGFVGGAHTFPGHGELLMEAGAETVVRRHAEIAPVVEALRGWAGVGG